MTEMKEKQYRLVVGCNWPNPKGKGEIRGEAGDVLPASAFKPASVKALGEMGALVEVTS